MYGYNICVCESLCQPPGALNAMPLFFFHFFFSPLRRFKFVSAECDTQRYSEIHNLSPEYINDKWIAVLLLFAV